MGCVIPVIAATGSTPGFADCNGASTATAYYSTALPLTAITGRRAFASTGSGSIFYDATGVAPTEAQKAAGGGGIPLQ